MPATQSRRRRRRECRRSRTRRSPGAMRRDAGRTARSGAGRRTGGAGEKPGAEAARKGGGPRRGPKPEPRRREERRRSGRERGRRADRRTVLLGGREGNGSLGKSLRAPGIGGLGRRSRPAPDRIASRPPLLRGAGGSEGQSQGKGEPGEAEGPKHAQSYTVHSARAPRPCPGTARSASRRCGSGEGMVEGRFRAGESPGQQGCIPPPADPGSGPGQRDRSVCRVTTQSISAICSRPRERPQARALGWTGTASSGRW